ncbi:unnamed protein product [Chrysoparadoxa australica]
MINIPIYSLAYLYAATMGLDEVPVQDVRDVIINTGSGSTVIVTCTPGVNTGGCYNQNTGTEPELSMWACSNASADGRPVSVGLTQWETVAVALAADGAEEYARGAQDAGMLFTDTINTSAPELHGAGTAIGGVLGLGLRPDPSCVVESGEGPFMSILKAQSTAASGMLFAIDLVGAGMNGTLTLGGYDSSYDSLLRWSEHPAAILPRIYTFPLFGLSLCQVQVFGKGIGSWPAVVDTGSACLTLPAEAFDSVVAWAPVVQRPCPVVDGQQTCFVSPQQQGLPDLVFGMSHSGERLRIPLSDLLLGPELSDSSGNSRLCIRRGSPGIAAPDEDLHYFSQMPLIVLGSQCLKSMYAVFDADTGRVALANKAQGLSPSDQVSTQGCPAAATCPVGQRYNALLNTCNPPQCQAYYFHKYDESSGTCRLTLSFKTALWVFAVLLGLTDLVSHCLKCYYGELVMRANVQSTATAASRQRNWWFLVGMKLVCFAHHNMVAVAVACRWFSTLLLTRYTFELS